MTKMDNVRHQAQEVQAAREPSDDRARGELAVSGVASAAVTTHAFSLGNFGNLPFEGLAEAMHDLSEQAETGDLTAMRSILVGQAVTLNAVFSEMARRAAANMGASLPATEIYMRLALKAQAQGRSTIEALDRITCGREQTVRHVHVNEGGQAIVAEQLHHHSGGGPIEKPCKQPHAKSSQRPALPSANESRNAVSIASVKGQTPVSNARRQGKRRSVRQP